MRRHGKSLGVSNGDTDAEEAVNEGPVDDSAGADDGDADLDEGPDGGVGVGPGGVGEGEGVEFWDAVGGDDAYAVVDRYLALAPAFFFCFFFFFK